MTAADLAALAVYATLMTFTPGPNTALSTALGAAGGLRRALPFVLSVPLGWSLMLVACAVGLGAVATVAVLRSALVAAACIYLLWLAWTLARRTALPDAAGPSLRVSFWQGVILQFANGKVWLLLATIATTWIAVGDGRTGARLMAGLPLVAAYGLASNLTYAAVGAALRSWLAHGRRLVVFNRALALAMVLTAAWIAAREWLPAP